MKKETPIRPKDDPDCMDDQSGIMIGDSQGGAYDATIDCRIINTSATPRRISIHRVI